jgi:AICAR transformylase/IMP cyclohydrolase PurH
LGCEVGYNVVAVKSQSLNPAPADCVLFSVLTPQAGVAAIAHPGGSIRDQDAVDCCNKYGVAIVTTAVRHFKH